MLAAVPVAVPAAVPVAVPAAVPAAVLVEVPLINALKSKPRILQVNINLSEKIFRRISRRQRYLHFKIFYNKAPNLSRNHSSKRELCTSESISSLAPLSAVSPSFYKNLLKEEQRKKVILC